MLRRGKIGTFVIVALVAELVVFLAVAERIGVGSAMLLSIATSVLGTVMLRRSGASALASLRSMAGSPLARESALVDGMLGATGAVLLIVPGFLGDLVGLFLLAPSGRHWLVRRIGVVVPGRPASSRQSGTIDLGSGDWTRLDNLRQP